jgi:hypothetical protein
MNDIERREHSRNETAVAIMVTPNGDFHRADILDLSAGGARVCLWPGWAPPAGTRLRMFFRLDARSELAIEGKVARVGVDHVGVQFGPAQENQIRTLLQSVSKAP